jgi:lipid-A-disaccharide synthase
VPGWRPSLDVAKGHVVRELAPKSSPWPVPSTGHLTIAAEDTPAHPPTLYWRHVKLQAPRILLSSGETSGDLYGAELVRQLRPSVPGLSVVGLGGDRLRAEGAQLLAHVSEMAVVGLWEVVSHLRRIRGVYRRVLREIDAHPPDLAILIDYPDFNLRLAKELHRRHIPVVYYVSPQLWAWRRGRLRSIRETVARMLVIFPFEEPLYRDAGVSVTFVGHPLVDLVEPPGDRGDFLRQRGLDPERPVIAVLPGSRQGEVAHNLGPLTGGIARLARRRPDLQFLLALAPSLEPATTRQAVAGLPVQVEVGNAHGVLAASTLALVASGTATVEAALLGTPMVVVYRLSPVTYALGRPFVRVPHYAMVNLIAGREIVPEIIQRDFTPERTEREALAILEDAGRRDEMKNDLLEVRRRLGGPGASQRAADVVLEVLANLADPRGRVLESAPATVWSPSRGRSLMGKKILVVDDDENILNLERTILEQKGFDVTGANGGAEALRLLADQAFDLVLLDVMMPEVDGFAVCRKIKEDPRLKDMPVIFLTAKGGGEALAEGFESGAVMYINKPFTANKLLTIVNTMLESGTNLA